MLVYMSMCANIPNGRKSVIDIDFLIMAINDEELEIHESPMKSFIVIGENFRKENRKIRGWNLLFLTHPEKGKCHFQIEQRKEPVQQVSIEDYNRIKSLLYIEPEADPIGQAKENQEMIMNYLRQKIENYDNGVNKKL